MQWAGQEKAESSTKHAVPGFASRGHPLPAVALTGVLGDSITSLWMDLGRGFLCLAPAGRGLTSVSMSFISFSCFLLRYSCLINSRRALSSSFFMRSSSTFSLWKKTDIVIKNEGEECRFSDWQLGWVLPGLFFLLLKLHLQLLFPLLGLSFSSQPFLQKRCSLYGHAVLFLHIILIT